MPWYGWLTISLLAAGCGVTTGVLATLWGHRRNKDPDKKRKIRPMIEAHFRPLPLDDLTISERRFPFRVRADLQRALERLFEGDTRILHFCGVHKRYSHDGVSFTGLLLEGYDPPLSVPPQYEEVDIGADEPVRCLKNGLWFLQEGPTRLAVFLSPVERHFDTTGMQCQIATPNTPEGTRITQAFFQHLEDAILRAESYRGKVLSLEREESSYSGESSGITVHRLRPVARDQLILPESTLELLERNVLQFTRQRERLKERGLPTKKGLLFYGPPGTGKTHTIHYLAGALERHTTLLISGEQIGLLAEYMTLARLLQPSTVVLEDVDLIAKERTDMGPCAESLLNRLLNEMDGLKEEADILFVLTTNRPEALEAALASRPGRIDQAIEFPLPDGRGREKLVALYAAGVELPPAVVRTVVKRTEGVSAAFIKELMRRSVQFQLERDGSGPLAEADVERALEEMLFRGGSLNQKLLGAGTAIGFARPAANSV